MSTDRRWRLWPALCALVVVLVVLVVVPAGLGKAQLHWPAWLVASITSGAAILVSAVFLPLVTSRVKVETDRVSAEAEQRRQREQVVRRAVGAQDLPLVRDVRSRAALGIHPAIPLPPGADQGLSAELPTYVPRDRDADVRTALTRMMSTGGFLLLVGPPASGKTRCAATAMQQLLGDWRLYLRWGTTDLASLLDAGVSLAHTAVWLDDIHTLIESGGSGTDGGGAKVSADLLRRLLLPRIGPVIIIGTTWPDRRDRYSAPAPVGGSDLLADARQVMDMAEQVDLSPQFSDSEWQRARSLAATDPRLAEAVERGEGRAVAATLASAHELIRRWRHGGDPYGRAVLRAAVDARRCGHPEPLPEALIESLAGGFLTGPQRAAADPQRWLAGAISWACTPIRGDIAPLSADAATLGQVDGYRVSDILVDAASRGEAEPISDQTWTRVAEAAVPAVCGPISAAAWEAGRPVVAEHAAARGAKAGDLRSLNNLANLLVARGELVEAERLYRRAIDGGHVDALYNLANLLRRRGDLVEAERLYRQAIEAGNVDAPNNLAHLLRRQGDLVEAERLYRLAIDAGHTDALNNLAILLKWRGDLVEAERLYRLAIDAGQVKALNNLAILLRERGELVDAEPSNRRAVETGSVDPLTPAFQRKESGEPGEADPLYPDSSREN